MVHHAIGTQPEQQGTRQQEYLASDGSACPVGAYTGTDVAGIATGSLIVGSTTYTATFSGGSGASELTLSEASLDACEYKYQVSSGVNAASAGGIVAGLSAVVMMLL